MNKQPLLIRDAYDFGPLPSKPRETPWEKLYRFFFGDDVFISYARSDAIRYVPSLAARLSAKKHICFFDQLVADPNEDLSEKLKKKILRSTVFVLVGTKGAVASSFVRKEIELFRRTRRPFIPVDVDGVLVEQEGWRDVVGVAKIREEGARVRDGDPSPEVVNLIKDSFRYTRRSQWLRASLLAGVSVIFITTAVSLLVIRAAQAEAAAIKRLADSEVAAANKKVGEAEQGLQNITAEADRLKDDAYYARNQAESAGMAAQVAVAQQEAAEQLMRQAQEVERQSTERAAETARREAGSRAALLAREPGMEFDALAVALEAAEQGVARQGEIPRQVMNGLTTSASAIDYALPLEDVGTRDLLLPRISPNGEKIVGPVYDLRSQSSGLVFWDARTGKSSMSPIEMAGMVASPSFSRDGKRLAALINKEERQSMFVWDVAGPRARLLRSMCDVEGYARQIALDSDGSHVITLGGEVNRYPVVSVCEIANGRKEVLTNSSAVYSVAFTPEGEPAVYGKMTVPGEGDVPRAVYFPRSGRKIVIKPPIDPNQIGFVDFGDDGSVILIIRDYKVSGHDSVYVQGTDGNVRRFTGYRGAVSWAAFVAGQARVVTVSGRGARVADTRSLPNFTALRAHSRQLDMVAFSPDDQTVLTVGDDGKGRLWDVQTGRLRHTLTITDELLDKDRSGYHRPKHAAFQADGTRLVTANDKGEIQMWDVETGHPGCSVLGQSLEISKYLIDISFLVGGDYVIAAYSKEHGTGILINFLDARTCVLAGTSELDARMESFSFSRDGTTMLTFTPTNNAYIWDKPELKFWSLRGVDLRSGAPIQLASSSIGLPTGILLSFTFNGPRLLAVTVDATGQLWMSGGNSLVRLEGGAGAMMGIYRGTFSADGTRAAAVSLREARVWDTRSGKLLVAFKCDPDVHSRNPVALSSDGSKLVITGRDNTVRIYPTSREAFFRVVRRLSGR